MHGEFLKVRCEQCDTVYEWDDDVTLDDICEHHQSSSSLRPHVVWFGEMPLQMDVINTASMQVDYFVAIGTSDHVYFAAGFVEIVRQCRAYTVEINFALHAVESLFEKKSIALLATLFPNLYRT